MLTASQCRAARGLLDWTQQDLADAARIGVATVRLFEGEATEARPATLTVLKQAFEMAGVEFTNGDQPGVRLTKAPGAQSQRRQTKAYGRQSPMGPDRKR
jgi:transcriptional regulator with XRE-family HTH domain